MNTTERNVWVALVSSLLVNAWFASRIYTMFHDGTATAADGVQIWARTILWVVPAAIVSTIVLTILASILHGIVTGERNPTFLKDERDRQFELWGLGATMLFMVFGFFGAMIGLAFGLSAFVAFNLIYLTFFLGDLAGNLVRLGCYRCM